MFRLRVPIGVTFNFVGGDGDGVGSAGNGIGMGMGSGMGLGIGMGGDMQMHQQSQLQYQQHHLPQLQLHQPNQNRGQGQRQSPKWSPSTWLKRSSPSSSPLVTSSLSGNNNNLVSSPSPSSPSTRQTRFMSRLSNLRHLRPQLKFFEARFSLNPGPWNIKEHVLVYIMANVAVGNPYALNAIVVAEIFYNIKLGFWFNLVLTLATQLTGFGLAGLCRRFLVWPASMVWPQNLVACALLNTLHAEEDAGDGGSSLDGVTGAGVTSSGVPGAGGVGNGTNGASGTVVGGGGGGGGLGGLSRRVRTLSRYKYYLLASGISFLFFFLPGFIFTALSVFSWVCWIWRRNVVVNQLFGVYSGLGMSVLTFDWTQISWIGSPLMVPWWAECHVFAGEFLQEFINDVVRWWGHN